MAEPRSSKLEANIVSLTTAIGAAMAKWQEVEGNIFLLFVALAQGGPLPNSCTVIYETIMHLEHKLAAVDALAQYRLASKDAKLLEQWTKLNKRIKRKSRIRNKVAHWRVWYDTKSDPDRPFLAPHLYRQLADAKDFSKSSGGALGATDILAHAAAFGALADEIRQFLETYAPITSQGKST